MYEIIILFQLIYMYNIWHILLQKGEKNKRIEMCLFSILYSLKYNNLGGLAACFKPRYLSYI